MKLILKFLGKLFLFLLAISLAVILFCWVKNLLYLGSTDDSVVSYLEANKKNVLAEWESRKLFDSDFYNNKVFLLGENHGTADVQVVDKALLIHLNKMTGLRYYLAEVDSTRANNLNAFLINPQKDTALLKQVVRDIALRIPQQSSKELFSKWSEIYDYNKGLADSVKITVLGIDADFEDAPRTISRDSIMYLNFKRIVEANHLENEQFYGLFGFTHVLQSGINKGNSTPFAAKIRKSGLSLANQVKSIVCYNLDSEVFFPRNDQYPTPPDERITLLNVDGPLLLVKGINDLKEVTQENTITLFDMEKPNSPFRNSQRLAGVKVNFLAEDILPNNVSQSTTDFFQYVVLIRNSKALTKLN